MGLKEENAKLQKKWDDLNFEHSRLMLRVGEIEGAAQAQYRQIESLKAELKEVSASSIRRGEQIEGMSVRLETAQHLAASRLASLEESQREKVSMIQQITTLTNTGIGHAQTIADLAAALKALAVK